MNIFEKAKILGDSGKYDSCGPKACEVKIDKGLGGIYHAKAEHKDCRLFKTLMNNSCSYDCKYCPNRNRSQKKVANYKPSELASLFNYLQKENNLNGLFLSSCVSKDQDKVTKDMIEAVKLIRNKYKFKGYIHFKVLPGTSYDLIKEASVFSTRMSINIESPNKEVLSELSSNKDYKIDILRRQSWISRLRLEAGQTTQMIVNNLATDKDILKMVDWEYNSFELKRIYFSAFRPIKGTPLENEKRESPLRQNHLYNVDFLLREYKFKLKEINLILKEGMLPSIDPKLALAKETFDSPIDINDTSFDELIRVPGIGIKTAKNILKSKKITNFVQLQKLGTTIKRAKPFIVVEGKRQTRLKEF